MLQLIRERPSIRPAAQPQHAERLPLETSATATSVRGFQPDRRRRSPDAVDDRAVDQGLTDERSIE
jgi:hypothetical protein